MDVQGETVRRDETLASLSNAENDVLEMMKIAQATVEEMQRLPQCSPERLQQLSQAYLSKLRDIQDKLKGHSSLLEPQAGKEARDEADRKAERESLFSAAQRDIEEAIKALDA